MEMAKKTVTIRVHNFQVEKGLNKRDKENVTEYYYKFCRPLVSSHTTATGDIRERDALSKLELTERHIKGKLRKTFRTP